MENPCGGNSINVNGVNTCDTKVDDAGTILSVLARKTLTATFLVDVTNLSGGGGFGDFTLEWPTATPTGEQHCTHCGFDVLTSVCTVDPWNDAQQTGGKFQIVAAGNAGGRIQGSFTFALKGATDCTNLGNAMVTFDLVQQADQQP